MKNYYKIMGLRMSAAPDDIKRVYRMLAKRYHPDLNPGNDAAASKFADVLEAYDVLSDPKKRADYDVQIKTIFAQKNALGNNIYYNQSYRPQNQQYSQNTQYQQNQQYGYTQNNQQYQGAYGQNQYQGRQGYDEGERGHHTIDAEAAYHLVNEAQRSGFDKGYNKAMAETKRMVEAAVEEERLKYEQERLKYEQQFETAEADKRRQLEEVRRRLNDQIERYKKQCDDLNAKITDLNRIHAENELKRRDREKEVKFLVEEFEKDRGDYERKLTIANLKIEDAAAQAAKLETELKETKLRAVRADKNASEARLKLSDSSRLNAALEKEMKKAAEEAAVNFKRVSDRREAADNENVKLKTEVENLKAVCDAQQKELETLRQSAKSWDEYKKSLNTANSLEFLQVQREKYIKESKKKSKDTLYNVLGLLIWSDLSEIEESYAKLKHRYEKKPDDPKFAAKLAEVTQAYETLSDMGRRAEYNQSIGINETEVETGRRTLSYYDENINKLMTDKDEQEFWAKIEELMYNAQTGDSEAQFALGELYYYGDELDQNLEQAVYWFKEAAKQRHPEAMYYMGQCFLRGEGFPADAMRGKGFIKQAALLGCKQAVEALKEMDRAGS